MGLLFDRIVRVTFGRPGEEGTRVTNLFTQFEVEKTSESNPNKVKIAIANLNSTSRSVLDEKGLIVRLEVGYQGVPEELFLGNITKAATRKEGTDFITLIEAGDSQNKFRDARVNTTLGPGATGKQAIETLTRAMGVGVGAVKGLTTQVFQQGLTLEGPVKDKLDEVVGKMGLEWSIQDQSIQILPPDTPSEALGILLSKETGLIESPVKKDKGIEFRAMMRVAIKPGVALQIDSRFIKGFFKVRKATYTGDNRKGPFEVQCEAVEIESGAIEVSEQLNIPIANLEGFA